MAVFLSIAVGILVGFLALALLAWAIGSSAKRNGHSGAAVRHGSEGFSVEWRDGSREYPG